MTSTAPRQTDPTPLEPIVRLSRDLRRGLAVLSPREARYLVSTYYQIQDYRTASANQVRALTTSGEPSEVLQWLFDQMETLENQIKVALDKWTDTQPVGSWLRSIYGVGPVIAAGLLAHIDITRSPTVGHIWRFAGLDPTVVWEKGQKRPWNAQLKVICWKASDSMVKFHNRDDCYYGKIYAQRKALEVERNDAGLFAEQAARELTRKRYGTDTEAFKHYSAGKLPPAHLEARARRYAVKLLLAALHEVAYWTHYRQLPPNPYPLEHLGHVHRLHPPNLDGVPGLREAKIAAGQFLPEHGPA